MIDELELKKIADLAKLEVPKENFSKLLNDMKNIVDFVNKINSVSSDEEGFFGFDNLNNKFRSDEIVKSVDQNLILKNCKTPEEGFFKVNLNSVAED